MPACRNRLTRRLLGAAFTAALSLGLAACATQPAGTPSAPDQSVLAPAQQALSKAMSAHADDFAPQSVDAARRRITIARDILFSASKAQRPLSDKQNDRVKQLVADAKLDARAALVETQAKAVETKIKQLQSPPGGGSDSNSAMAGQGMQGNGDSTGEDQGLGIASPTSGDNNSGDTP